MCYLESIRTLARTSGVEKADLIVSKNELVRSIQEAHQCKACFQCKDRYACMDMQCEWREACLTSLVEFIN